jgi:hypothetical protein
MTPRGQNVPEIKSVGSAPEQRAALEGPLVAHRVILWYAAIRSLSDRRNIIERFAEPD